MSEQAAHLARVAANIESVIVRFCAEHDRFHADELRRFVNERVQAAPGSPDRVLRLLRQRGVIDYVVKDRRASLYEMVREGQMALKGIDIGGEG